LLGYHLKAYTAKPDFHIDISLRHTLKKVPLYPFNVKNRRFRFTIEDRLNISS